MAKWPYNTSKWQRLREAKLMHAPLCYACDLRGQVAPAVAVDHVRPIRAGSDPFPALNGLLSLCERCHNEKTSNADRRSRSFVARRFKGFDVNGNPIDPGDAWHGTGGPSKDGEG